MSDLELGAILSERAVIWAYLKVPYRHRGTTRNGADCTGLLIGLLREIGFLHSYVLRDYSVDWNLHRKSSGNYVLQELEKFAYPVERKDLSVGDVLVFWFGNCESHVGLYVGKGLFVHAYLTSEVVKYALLRDFWEKRLSFIYRFSVAKLQGSIKE